MDTLWKQISRRTIHLIPGKQIQVPPVFQQDLQWVVTDWRAWQLFQCCCLLQEPHIFTLVWNNHVLMKSRICAAKLTLQVPPPDTNPAFPDPLPHLFKSSFLNQS